MLGTATFFQKIVTTKSRYSIPQIWQGGSSKVTGFISKPQNTYPVHFFEIVAITSCHYLAKKIVHGPGRHYFSKKVNARDCHICWSNDVCLSF